MATTRFTTFEPVFGARLYGLIWALLETVLGVSLLATVFALVLDAPPLGDSFALFYATGILPLALFTNLTVKCASVLRQSRGCQDALGAVVEQLLSALLLQLLVSLLILGGLLVWTEGRLANQQHILAANLALGLLAVGVGVLNSWITAHLRRWPQIWAAVIRPLFVLSGVFFLVDDVPDPFRDWLAFNPLVHVISLIRAGLYPEYSPVFADAVSVGLVGLSVMVIGLAALGRGRVHAVS